MLAISSYLLLFHVSRNGFQEDLFYNLPRHKNETVQRIIPWIVPLSNSEDGCCISISPIINDSVNFSKMARSSLTAMPAISINNLRYIPLGLTCMGQGFSRDP